ISLLGPTIKFRVALKYLPHKCERTLLVPRHINMRQFHFVIQAALGWTNSHLFEFRPEKLRASLSVGIENDYDYVYVKTTEAYTVQLMETFLVERVGKPFWYEYDFGDSWLHRITFLKTTQKDIDLYTGLPLCVKATAKCPPEDCGGIWGYEDFLEAIKDKKHPEHREYKVWIGMDPRESYDEMEVSLEDINMMLMQLATSKFWGSKAYDQNIMFDEFDETWPDYGNIWRIY